VSDKERFLGGVNDFRCELARLIDVEDPVDLGDEAVGDSEAAVSGADDRSEGCGVRESSVDWVGPGESLCDNGGEFVAP
jgi:hypothetical protein